MSFSMAIGLFLALVILVGIYLAINIYNGLISVRQQVDRAWANIDVILKQRFDEIPQLIQIIEQFVQYERSTIEMLATARQHYGSAKNVSEKIDASKEMSSALRGILAIGEGYPELKSSNQFLQLQERISTLESTISDRRENYNETVTNYNTRILQFPDSIFANMLRYNAHSLYTVDKGETVKPNLSIRTPK